MTSARLLSAPTPSRADAPLGALAWWVALIAFVAHLGFIPGVSSGVGGHELLNYDDPQVVALARNRSVAEILGSTTYYAYKPLYFLSLKLDLLLDEDGAGLGHVVNLLLFALAAWLLVKLLFQLTGSRWLAFAAGVLFAVHPVHVESVAWLSGRKDVLSLVFALLAHLAYRRARDLGRVPLLAPLLLAFAGLTKGTVWTWAGLFVVDELLERRRGARGALARLLPSLLVAVAGIAMDATIGARAGPGAVDHGVGTSQLMAAMAGVHADYLRLLLAPLGLTLDHDVDPAGAWSAPAAWAGALLALGALATLVLAVRRGATVVAFVAAFWILGLAPVNNVWPRTTTLMAERYLLVGAVGVYLGLAWLCARAGAWRGVVLGVAATALGVLSIARTDVFATSERVWADAVAKRPESALAWMQRAQAQAARREYARAQEGASRALALAERHPRVHSARVRVQAHLVAGAAHLGRGDLDALLRAAGEAGMAARAASGRGLEPEVALRLEAEAEVLRGQALQGLEQPAGARAAYARAVALDPENVAALYNLATLLLEQAKEGEERGLAEALGLIQRVRQRQPGWLDAGLQQAKALLIAGRTQEALGLYQDLEARHGPAPDLLLARAQHFLAAGPADRALKDLERLRREHPDHPRASRLVFDLYVADARRLLDEARRDGKRDGLPKALERAEEAQKASPDLLDGWLVAGDVLYEQGKLLAAADRYRRAYGVDRKAKWILGLVARAATLEAAWLARRADDAALREGAARVFAQALAEGVPRIDLGLVPLELELPWLRRAVERLEEPEPVRGWAVGVLLAAARLAAGDDAGAHDELARVIAAHPQEQGAQDLLEAALLLRAGVSERSTDTQSAEEDYALVARLKPGDPVPELRRLQVALRSALARRSIAQGWAPDPQRLEAARTVVAQAKARPADAPAPDPTVAREIADAEKVVADARSVAEADVAVTQVGERIIAFADAHPAVLEAGLLAAESEMRRQRWVEALRRLNDLAERFPEHPSVLRGQAAVYLNQYLVLRDASLVEEALTALHRAVRLDPRDPRTALDASGARRIGGDLRGALAWALRARAYENLPGGPAARELAGLHAAMGEQALEANDRPAALKAVAAAREVDPGLAAAYVLEGRIMLELADAKGQRDPAGALQVLMKAKELEPANLAVDRLLATAWYQRGLPTAVGLRLVRDPVHPAQKDPEGWKKLGGAAQQERLDAYERARAEQRGKREALRAQAVSDLRSSLRLDPQGEHAPQARAMLESLADYSDEDRARRAKQAMESLAKGAGHLAVKEYVDAYLAFEDVLAIDPDHRKASFYLVQAAYERLAAGGLPEDERRDVTNRAFERLQALDALDPNGEFPPRHLYRALLNETLYRRTGHEDARQAALRAYERYVARVSVAPALDEATRANLEMARRRRVELERRETPR
jgi:hypothetical protein